MRYSKYKSTLIGLINLYKTAHVLLSPIATMGVNESNSHRIMFKFDNFKLVKLSLWVIYKARNMVLLIMGPKESDIYIVVKTSKYGFVDHGCYVTSHPH